MNKYLFSMICSVLAGNAAVAQSPLDFNRTLRIDYQFAGNTEHQHISLTELQSFKGWAGRKVNMEHPFLRGNGQICMKEAQTGKVLYSQSFSTLFQEWLTTAEAVHTSRSFENTFLLPMPSVPVNITVNLYGLKEAISAEFTHKVNPKDILIRNLDAMPVIPHRYLLKSGDPSEKIDVAIVAEGYTGSQCEDFYRDARRALDAILSHEPFKSRASDFNFVAVAPASADSDVSIPKEGIWRNTALSSHFSTFYSDRYLTTLRQRDLHNYLVHIPYEHIIILANTYTYGGGGIYNAYTLTTTHHQDFFPVVVHEFGHSFAGLADEYYYDDQYENYYSSDIEPWEQNLTTLKDFDSKWKDMLPARINIPTPQTTQYKQTIGVYEGGGYMSKGVYRPYQDCRMKTNAYPVFCPVCQRAISRIIDFYTIPITPTDVKR